MTNMRSLIAAAAVSLCAFSSACGPTVPRDQIRGFTDKYVISVTADSLPPHAMDDVVWRVTVKDRKTGLPVQGGEGMVWHRSKDGRENLSGLVSAPELGTYTTKLRLVMAAPYQMGVRFRPDSLTEFADIAWIQEVIAPRPYGG